MELPKNAGEGMTPRFKSLVRISNGELPFVEKIQELAATRLGVIPPLALHFLLEFLKNPETILTNQNELKITSF